MLRKYEKPIITMTFIDIEHGVAAVSTILKPYGENDPVLLEDYDQEPDIPADLDW